MKTKSPILTQRIQTHAGMKRLSGVQQRSIVLAFNPDRVSLVVINWGGFLRDPYISIAEATWSALRPTVCQNSVTRNTP